MMSNDTICAYLSSAINKQQKSSILYESILIWLRIMFDFADGYPNSVTNTVDRIDYFSRLFLGKPYISGAQGEGSCGEFDRAPLYRFDGFDCVTYVNNVLSLALSGNETDFQKKLLLINYYNSIPKYENRFHFMSVDWNPENQKNKIVVDVSKNIAGDSVLYAEGEIDRPNWFLRNLPLLKRGVGAQHRGDFNNTPHIKKQLARVPYVPLAILFDLNKNPIDTIFQKIPHASVVEIVRPNWNLKEKIGTNLHISHLGFAIRRNTQLYFRHASSEAKCVVEVLLSDYLYNCLESPTIKGINVQAIAE